MKKEIHSFVEHEVISPSFFDENGVLHELKHYLPAQSPLKDFIHHNTLHAFQNIYFHDALRNASEIFGYKVSLTLDEYRELYHSKRIDHSLLDKIITDRKGAEHLEEWKRKLISKHYETPDAPRVGTLRSFWKKKFHLDLDAYVHPIIFRVLCSYLDQGIAMWNFPVRGKGFLDSIKEIERNSYTSFFKTERARKMLLEGNHQIVDLLKIVVGKGSLFKQYLFDQQFAHQGWSGMVAAIEQQPETLLDKKDITLHDVIVFELLLEIDALDNMYGEIWAPLGINIEKPIDIFAEVHETELHQVFVLWQEAFEWTYYDDVLRGLKQQKTAKKEIANKSFQALFCIDDRECSIRRYLETFDPQCETFGTPGFFGVEFYYQPENGKFYNKLCPAPVTPKYLIKEVGAKEKRKKDLHFTHHTHTLLRGWLISQTVGFWSAFRLFLNIFRPAMTPAAASSFKHMDKFSKLTIQNKDLNDKENGLQIGFTVEEMAERVEGVLTSIGLVKDFAPIVYSIAHGASSVNNPHYAAYDCGACCGRPGSVNSRVLSFMANHKEVRKILAEKGIVIPEETQFVGGLQDTTRDEILFFDLDVLSETNKAIHMKNGIIFEKALDHNAKERSRRFEYINTKADTEKIHEQIKRRAVTLFEPRPELNHATNALCIVGGRHLTRNLFLDRRSFLNSYDHKIDPDGKFLFNVMKPLGPVCGGINLEYFFSRVDNQKLGAGTKLPHNVMGLFGVANGAEGDLRPGLPSQMIEVHDPIRLMIIVEHFPDVVLKTIQKAPDIYEWYINEWIHLVAMHPETGKLYLFDNGVFVEYEPHKKNIEEVSDLTPIIESEEENMPVLIIKN
ncbi:MAG: YbcC family protein [Bacteroidia bacterium]